VEDQDSEGYDSQGYHFACQDGCNYQSQGKPVMKKAMLRQGKGHCLEEKTVGITAMTS
jgi:hypothetical protein